MARALRGSAGLLAALVLLLSLPFPARAAGDEYTIGARDVLAISVWGQPDLSRDYVVEPDGFVPFPLVGRVKAAGLTPKGLAARLKEGLEKDYLVNPQVIVSVKEYLSQRVTVIGEAEKPGVYYLSGPTTVLDILSKAGGLTKAAGSQVVVVRKPKPGPDGGAGGSVTRQVSFERMKAGDPESNIGVEDDDTIFVPRGKGNTFFVLGEVRKPGSYQLDGETSILEGITLAGGFTDKAAPGRTRILRNTPNGQEVLYVDMNDVMKRGHREKAVILRENDVVVVPESFF
ncbi:MAG TPA: polysaccharide biosynthesis/export family protein [Methylomirabilota bacterium]|nr:polysaccharide biosynthesis/export family protein [Methylomirabilota bacterium]